MLQRIALSLWLFAHDVMVVVGDDADFDGEKGVRLLMLHLIVSGYGFFTIDGWYGADDVSKKP